MSFLSKIFKDPVSQFVDRKVIDKAYGKKNSLGSKLDPLGKSIFDAGQKIDGHHSKKAGETKGKPTLTSPVDYIRWRNTEKAKGTPEDQINITGHEAHKAAEAKKPEEAKPAEVAKSEEAAQPADSGENNIFNSILALLDMNENGKVDKIELTALKMTLNSQEKTSDEALKETLVKNYEILKSILGESQETSFA